MQPYSRPRESQETSRTVAASKNKTSPKDNPTKEQINEELEKESFALKQIELIMSKYLVLAKRYEGLGKNLHPDAAAALVNDSRKIYRDLQKIKSLYSYQEGSFFELLGRAYRNLREPTPEEQADFFFSKRQRQAATDDNYVIGKQIDERMDLFFADVMTRLPHKDYIVFGKED